MKRRIKPGSRPLLDHCGATGKVRFRSEEAALETIPAIEARHRKRGRDVTLRAYRCARCNDGWHVSSRPAA